MQPPRGRCFRHLRAGALLLAALACASCFPGGQRRRELKGTGMRITGGSLGMRYETEREKRTTQDSDVETVDTVMEEVLELNAEGAVYHPNLLEFTTQAAIAFTQEEYEENGRSDSQNGDLFEYDFSATMLREKRAPMTFYMRRSDELVPRRFAPSLSTQRTSYGFGAQWLSERIPMRFSFDSDESIEKQSSAGAETSSSENWVAAWSGQLNMDRAGTLSMGYSHGQTQEDVTSTTQETDEINLGHSIYIDSGERYRLQTNFDYLDEAGEPALTDTDVRAALNARHTRNFSTDYSLGLQERERDGLKEELTRWEAGFRHQLFESLVTTGRLHGSEEDLSSGLTTTRSGRLLQLDYRKGTPWGSLGMGTSFDTAESENKGLTSTSFVTNEAHNLSSALPSILVQRSIVVSSIVVTNAAGTQTYTETIDYTITQVGSRVHLYRSPASPNIIEGDTVHVDYDFVQIGGITEESFTTSYYILHRFSFGFTPFYRYTNREADISPPQTDLQEDSETSVSFGFEQKLGRLTLNAEWRDTESETSPFRSARYSANYFVGSFEESRLSIGVEHSSYEFLGVPQRTTEVNSIRLTWERQITTNLGIGYGFEYRDENDSVSKTTTTMINRFGLLWSHRAMRMKMYLEQSSIEDQNDTTDRLLLAFSLQRVF